MLLVPPGGGDDLQASKKGIMEASDLVVVNKADGRLLEQVSGRGLALSHLSYLSRLFLLLLLLLLLPFPYVFIVRFTTSVTLSDFRLSFEPHPIPIHRLFGLLM